jgi:hypothetical protein
VHDLDLVVATKRPEAITKFFVAHRTATEELSVQARGTGKENRSPDVRSSESERAA